MHFVCLLRRGDVRLEEAAVLHGFNVPEVQAPVSS